MPFLNTILRRPNSDGDYFVSEIINIDFTSARYFEGEDS